ncbi:MAG: TonB-dependent receptor [Flavisolibacter sp.]|nr:TonB-dependent receptor [Flavisolibacter sp.]
MLKRILTLLVLALLFGQYLNAQVTTSNISGTAKAANGEALVGATVVATHEPTGTVYRTATRTGGRFDIQNVAPGGPYTIKVSYVGYNEITRKDISIPLGETFDLQAELPLVSQQLSEVVVSGTRTSTVKTGATTNINNRLIRTIPNVSRSITSLTRLTPQANGNSFAGMNWRYNNITIDGSVFNNNFGRSGDGLVPGGGRSISLDAIDQIQVNISPFDVRQAGFIGGGINAVTRRGTNNLYVSAYTFQRPESFYGKKVKDQTVDTRGLSTKTYGASVGGAIIKNKLFFFVNAEKENTTRPGQIWLANSPETASNPLVTPVLKSDLDKLSEFLRSEYEYETGPYQGYNFGIDNYKVLGRIDWNITEKHRLTLRYTQSKTEDDEMVNTSSRPTGATAFGNGRRGGKTGGLAYANTNFKNSTEVKSGVAELNSTINSKVSNQLLASYTDNRPTRVPPSIVPFVDIMKDPNTVYISFGTDLFSYKNYIVDKAFNAAENLTFNLGKHTVTVGGSFDHMEFQNSFTSGSGGGYYRYASLQDFLDKKAPVYFAVSYDPSNPKGIAVPSAKFNQLGLYAQDVWAASSKFKLTYGLRIDKPAYPYTPPKNPALEAVTFKDENGNDEHFDVSKFPDAKILFSPRLGFTYDVAGDRSIIVRGGTGIFTGRIPFIWLVNQVGDNGVIRAQYQALPSELPNIKYSTDRTTYIPTNPPAVGTTIPSGSSYSAVAKDFKMPQVWRTNLAFEKKVSTSAVASVEAIYTKMINNAYFRNDNLGAQVGTLGGTADKRPIYNRNLNSAVATMAVLDNINKGMSFAVTPMIQKSFAKGWEASLAYTYTFAQEVAIGSSDQSASGWTTNNIIFNPNKPELSYSNFSIPHRVVGYASYRFAYMNNKLATTVGIYYSAASQERFHYRYSGDINGDGQSNDIIYIPKDPSEISFAPLTSGGVTYTPQQQSDAFFAFIENNKYLKKHKGQYMDRYGATLPWVQSLDLRVLEDFYIMSGGKKHNIQLSLDVTNLLNLLNKNWGYSYSYTYGTFQDQALLGVPSGFDKANPRYTFNPTGPTKAYQPSYSIGSTWGLNLGLRYIFN